MRLKITKLKFLKILINCPGITKTQIRKHFDFGQGQFRKTIRRLLAADLIQRIPEPNYQRTFPYVPENPGFVIKQKGKDALQTERTRYQRDNRLTMPDYPRIREILNVPVYTADAELADLWNELTDFYLPYGNEELRPIY